MAGKRLIQLALRRISAFQAAEGQAFAKEHKARGGQGGLTTDQGFCLRVGGYRAALYDVLQALDWIIPATRGWWEKRDERE